MLSINSLVFAQQTITLIVKENQSIRNIANEFLGDSNLWEDILRANKLNSPAQIKPGLKLVIPVTSIKENIETLNAAYIAINEASKVGAKLFAEELIIKANNYYEQALKYRKEGRTIESTKSSIQAKDEADKAIIESQKKSNTSGNALLSYKKGDVENKKPAELIWNEAELYAKLFEQYRTRTLSNSYAEISFKDLSKIRLYENSQAVIQSSRVDLLKNQKKATVNLEKGEAYALLLGNGKKKDFNLNFPGLNTKINSKLFWVQKESKETKIANYNGEIAVTAKDSMVVIRENEGSVVPDDGVPSEPKSLLPAPTLSFPEYEKTFYVSNINFRWTEITGAVNYYFMVSNDRTFETVVESDKKLNTTNYDVSNLNPGIYYWRVAAVDEIGFPGPFSKNGFFIVREDNTPPYLIINSPSDFFITKAGQIEITGSSETGIPIFINDEEIATDSIGNFNYIFKLFEGINKISVKAIDLGNNETIINRNVIYESNPEFKIDFSGNINIDTNGSIVSSAKSISISGKTRSKSLLKVFTQNGISLLKTYADENGAFEFLLSNLKEINSYKMFVETPAGYKKEKDFTINYNSTEPEIIFNNIPSTTSKSNFIISGQTINTAELIVNGEAAAINGNSFSFSANLKSGENVLFIEAVNKTGNTKSIEIKILLDTEAPVIKSKNVKTVTSDNFEIIKLAVTVEDKSELKRTAEVEYEIGGEKFKAYLRLDTQSNIYEGNIQILKSQKQNYRIVSIVLEDYLGNLELYNF